MVQGWDGAGCDGAGSPWEEVSEPWGQQWGGEGLLVPSADHLSCFPQQDIYFTDALMLLSALLCLRPCHTSNTKPCPGVCFCAVPKPA